MNDKDYHGMDRETRELCKSFDASEVVCYLSCECGRRHEVEYTPPSYEYGEAGIWCACGKRVIYGE